MDIIDMKFKTVTTKCLTQGLLEKLQVNLSRHGPLQQAD